jgi:hypothetical protein
MTPLFIHDSRARIVEQQLPAIRMSAASSGRAQRAPTLSKRSTPLEYPVGKRRATLGRGQPEEPRAWTELPANLIGSRQSSPKLCDVLCDQLGRHVV